VGFFGASQAGWVIPLAARLTQRPPQFNIILSGAAVSTGEEAFYSMLTGDGLRPAQVSDLAEAHRRLRERPGAEGFDPRPLLAASTIPTLWLLGGRDWSVPTLASVAVLDSITRAGRGAHTVLVYPEAGHDLRDVASGKAAPVWGNLLTWLYDRDLGP